MLKRPFIINFLRYRLVKRFVENTNKERFIHFSRAFQSIYIHFNRKSEYYWWYPLCRRIISFYTFRIFLWKSFCLTSKCLFFRYFVSPLVFELRRSWRNLYVKGIPGWSVNCGKSLGFPGMSLCLWKFQHSFQALGDLAAIQNDWCRGHRINRLR